VKRLFDRQEKQFKAIGQLRAMIRRELKRIEGYDPELAQRIRDEIGPNESSWKSESYQRVIDLERQTKGSMG